MQHLSDEELVGLVLDGNSEAFEIIVGRYQNQIFSLAYRLGGDYDEAKDMAQEAFIRVYRELPRFDRERRFFPWMYRVAHNTCINLLRRRPKETAPLESVFDMAAGDNCESGSPSARYEQLEQSETIHQALQALSDNYRLPLVLKYLEGMSYQEISSQLDLPISTIETRLFRGRALLRKHLSHIMNK
ncbi:MAG: sigma-70 family RNA polymerase sigma factor [Clostridia bacterium]|nr:sigma-70 family RNA polymerase sigma factor [Clostridia bacterium]